MAIANQLNSPNRTLQMGGVQFTSDVGIIGRGGTSAANAGSVGQIITATRATENALAVTNAVTTNIVSISLPAGQWLITGSARCAFSASGLSFNCGASTVSGVLPAGPVTATINNTPASLTNASLSLVPLIITNPAAVTVYITTASYFSSGTASVSGTISALLVR